MEQKHFVMVSTVGEKSNMGAMQHDQSTCSNNISIFVIRITCNLIPWVI